MAAADALEFIPSRKARGFALASAAVSAATAGVYWRVRKINPYRPVLEQIEFRVPPAHGALAGMKIGFVTDIHAGPFIYGEDVDAALQLLEDASPDLVLFGGDFVSESPRHLKCALPSIERLVEHAPLGGLAVLGNHDIFVSATQVTSDLEAIGLPVLRNKAITVNWRGAELWIAGIDDTLHGRPNPDGAFGQIPAGAAILSLWHEADFAETAASLGAFAQLSGHSHGGQVVFPRIRPIWLPKHGRRHVSGMNVASAMPVYTSRGMGVYRPPVRLNCPPEVTLVTLVADESTADAR
ncbi:MAG: metallophosphoesterase [Thermomicrobiales bacterium]|nr:metallophosphoesterase [Thermomicrobiales bacterium]